MIRHRVNITNAIFTRIEWRGSHGEKQSQKVLNQASAWIVDVPSELEKF